MLRACKCGNSRGSCFNGDGTQQVRMRCKAGSFVAFEDSVDLSKPRFGCSAGGFYRGLPSVGGAASPRCSM